MPAPATTEIRDISDLFLPQAAAAMHDAIVNADGNEVFFGAVLNDQALVSYIEVLARGNRTSVPVLINASLEFDLVIHNHPTGNLTPSDADVGIASELGNAGVGFVIIDSAVSAVYVVVPPLVTPKAQKINIPDALYLFTDDGDLKKLLPKYEYRHEQTVMAERVLESFNENKHLIVEAGTGVGKSLAYLVPALLWVKVNKGRIVISTNTINLQQQIIMKDIPDVVQALAPDVKYVLVKGRGNYVCIRKVKAFIKKEENVLDFDIKSEEEEFIRSIDEWLSRTSDGSVSDLASRPKSQFWELVQSEGDSCTKMSCASYADCFYYKMRKRINAAQILVVNHHILCADLSIHAQTGGRYSFLPRYEKVVIDEAHNFEESASAYFGTDGSRNAVMKNLNYLYQRRGTKQFGYIWSMRRIIERDTNTALQTAKDFLELVDRTFMGDHAHARDTVERVAKDFLSYCREYITGTSEHGYRFRVSEAFAKTEHWQLGSTILRGLVSALNALVNTAELVKTRFTDIAREYQIEHTQITNGADIYIGRLRSLVSGLNAAVDWQPDEYIRWFEVFLSRKGALYLNWHLTPVEVASYLDKHLYSRFESVVLTSATLSIDSSFDFFSERLGLTRILPERFIAEQLASPYDYHNHARLYIATDVDEPVGSGFIGDIVRYVKQAMTITRGRCFALFTSFATLSAVYNKTRDDLAAMGVNVLTQSGTLHRNTLLETFRASANNILFGVDSFWEGVDVVGEHLEMIIIPKIPFVVPTDPITEARQEYIEANGGNAFIDYITPLAVIKFKQGFGRLIRSKTDRGVVLLLDKRMLTKNYGVKFRRSLPDVPVVSGSINDIMNDMSSFFGA
ncbi:MAG: DEAD/DEAH box helicase [Spirochaetes bacterium]|nr:DEAD/DEAH box helicase [Spirochaetota bacterium]